MTPIKAQGVGNETVDGVRGTVLHGSIIYPV